MKKTSSKASRGPVDELRKRLVQISHLSSILSLAHWDQEVYMPAKGADARAAALSELSGLIHSKFTGIDHDGLLSGLRNDLDAGKIKGKDAVIVAETWRGFERERKLPEEFVREMTEATSMSQGVWAEARKKNDFRMFLPWLEKIVRLKRREAEYVGYDKSPYDALIDAFEPGMTSAEAFQILNDLKDFLTPFLKRIKAAEASLKAKERAALDPKRLLGQFPIDRQVAFNSMLVEKMGFDMEAGRVDKTTHPFATGFNPQDVRITTRYREDDALYSLGGIIHEAGHGMYEQGLPVEHFGTPLSESVSLGIHESQSRMWENIIGKSLPFWRHFYPKLQKEFPNPFKGVPLADFHRIINRVSPSLIRTEADEVTYNLHVIIRFEIEKEMIEGSIDLRDLPKIWNAKMKEYLGVAVPKDSVGVLQDVHWSCGLFGYFPTYTLGNLYSAQFYAQMKKDMPDIDKRMAKGEFGDIKAWLRKHVHSHGKTHAAGALVRKATGENLSSSHFIEYLKEKYGKLYSTK